MVFKEKNIIIYCEDEYYKNFDNKELNIDKSMFYWKGYLIHRENGSAIEYISGPKCWYLNGKQYSKEQYWNIINLKKKNRVLNEI